MGSEQVHQPVHGAFEDRAWLPPHLDEASVVRASRRAGVGVEAVGPYRITSPGPGGLIFGYATVSEQAITEGIDRLAQVIGELG